MRRPEQEILTDNIDFLDHIVFESDQIEVPNDEQSDLIRSFIEELPPQYQEIYHLRYGEWMSIRKIAARLGFKSPWSIQVRLAQISHHVEHRLKEIE